jgi:hypothetical protein
MGKDTLGDGQPSTALANRDMDHTGTLASFCNAMILSGKEAALLLLGLVENATREKIGR